MTLILCSPEQAKKRIAQRKADAPMTVSGTLDLSDEPKLTKLPAGLSCYELNLSGTSIARLPDDLRVESKLVLRDATKLVELPIGLTVGTLDLQGCTNLEALPEKLDVWFLQLRGCVSLKGFPKSANIRNGSLSIAGCRQLNSLPNYLEQLATLDISDCPNIASLPKGLSIGLWIDVGGSGVKRLDPPNDQVGIRWRGVIIDHRIAFRAEELKAKEALQEKNAERRRIMIEQIGADRFMQEANATILDRDKDAGGNRELLKVPLDGDEPMVCLSCLCPSTRRHYFLRVPPTVTTCHQAAAWMAGYDDPSKYRPVIET
jgi:hypothetical protein